MLLDIQSWSYGKLNLWLGLLLDILRLLIKNTLVAMNLYAPFGIAFDRLFLLHDGS